MRMRALAALICLCAGLAQAEPLDTAEKFDTYTQGKTLYFHLGNGRGIWSAERYLPNNRVQWIPRDGECLDGAWYVEAGLICFVYEGQPDPLCWDTWVEGNGLNALLKNRPTATRIWEIDPGDETLQCRGPKVGV